MQIYGKPGIMADNKGRKFSKIRHLLHNASYATHSKGLILPYLSIDFRPFQHNSGYLKNFVSARLASSASRPLAVSVSSTSGVYTKGGLR